MKSITSDANPAFRRWLRLATTPRAAREFGETLAEGTHLAQSALDAGFPVRAVILRKGSVQPHAQELADRIGNTVPAYELAPVLYDRISPVEQGAGLMLVLPVPNASCPNAVAVDMVFLDGIQDPGNVGTIIRTAAAAGIVHVLASPGTAALWSPRVLRAGMGAHFRLGLHEQVDPEQLSAVLNGAWIAAATRGSTPLWHLKFPDGALGWVFGAEGSGASPAAIRACRLSASIPVAEEVESLNVAAAAAVCLFEVQRRRRANH